MKLYVAVTTTAMLCSCVAAIDESGNADDVLGENSEEKPEIEENVQPFWTTAAGNDDHGDLTTAALSFLLVKDRLAEQNELDI